MGKCVISQMILSFELPFALIPLLKFSSSTTKMGPHKNSIYVSNILPFHSVGPNYNYWAGPLTRLILFGLFSDHCNLMDIGPVNHRHQYLLSQYGLRGLAYRQQFTQSC